MSRRRLAGVLAAVLVGAAVGEWLGWPPWPVVLCAVLSAFLVLLRRNGIWLAAGVAVAGALLALLWVSTLSVYSTMPFDRLYGLAALVAGGAAIIRLGSGRGPIGLDAGRCLPALGAFVGVLVWVAIVAVARAGFNEFVRFWVVSRDGFGNYRLAAQIVGQNGAGLDPWGYAVPLPPSIIAIGLAAARRVADPAAIASADVESFLGTWGVAVAMMCVASGLAAMLLIPASRPRLRIGAAAFGSLLPLSPFIGGVALDYGFFNAVLVVPLLLIAWIAFVRRRAAVAAALALLGMIATLLLATWSPLAVVPLALGVVAAWTDGAELRRARIAELVVLGISIVSLVAYATGVLLPATLASPNQLAVTGAMLELSPWAFPIAAVIALLLAARLGRTQVVGVLVIALAFAGGLAVLVWANLGMADPWQYYPRKFAWFGVIALGLIGIGLLGGILGRIELGRRAIAVARRATPSDPSVSRNS